MKSLSRKLIALSCTAILSVVVAGCGSDSKEQSQSFKSSQVEEIIVKTEGQHIEMSPSYDDEVKVKVESGRELVANLSGDVLTIELGGSSGLINFSTETLYVEVPEKSYRKIHMSSTAGRVSGDSLAAKVLELSSESGKIKINGFSGEKIESSLVAGNVELLGVEGALEVKNDSGHVTVSHKGDFAENSSIRTNSGKVDVKFETSPNSLVLDVTTQSGSIDTMFATTSEVVTKGGEKQLNTVIGSESGAPQLAIRTSSGNITLR